MMPTLISIETISEINLDKTYLKYNMYLLIIIDLLLYKFN